MVQAKSGKRGNLLTLSGRGDSNSRPLGPEPSALAGLRYAPNVPQKIAEFQLIINEQVVTIPQ